MRDPADLRYTRTHEWVRVEKDHVVVGITEFAQQRLGDITHVELPEPEDHAYAAGEEICLIESLRTSADCHAPVAGTVVEINNDLLARPELINSDPYGAGWLVKMAPDAIEAVEHLMTLDEYEGALPEEEEE